MRNEIIDSLLTMLITIFVVVVTCMITAFPWWSFVIPVAMIGGFITFRKWKVQAGWVGFLSGFIAWLGASLYFDFTGNGIVLEKLGLMLAIPKALVIMITGLIGGVLSFLAILVGKSLFYAEVKDGVKEHIDILSADN